MSNPKPTTIKPKDSRYERGTTGGQVTHPHHSSNTSIESDNTSAERVVIAHNLDRLFDLRKYPFTALEIAASVDEEQVADIFVRINSKGVPLNQADFILTLLSVFWEDGRRDLETFCHAARTKATIGGKGSPFHHLIAPDPDQLLRVSIAFGFGRGRLKSVYQILRGKDAETGEFTSDKRDAQFELLKAAQAQVSYDDFLVARRALMAGVIRKGFDALC